MGRIETRVLQAYGSGPVSGSGAANRVAFWAGAGVLSSSANLTYDGTNFTVASGFITSTFIGDSCVLAAEAASTKRVGFNLNSIVAGCTVTLGFSSFNSTPFTITMPSYSSELATLNGNGQVFSATGLTFTNKTAFTAGIGVGNSAAATIAVGVLANKVEIFNGSGVSLGFLPVYATIT